MKTHAFFRPILVLGFVLLATALHAQAPAMASTGYWNAETNLTARNYSIVRFYNAQDQLVYEERLDNFCLDMRKNRQRRRISTELNLVLQQVLQQPATEPALLAHQFGQNRRIRRAYAAL